MVATKVAPGIHWVEIPDADLRILCACPADAVKHLMKRGFIGQRHKGGVRYETGPNAILLSDVPIQRGSFANLAEFPVLQMLYFQGMIVPGHPNNTGVKPMLIGLEDQVRSQSEYIIRGNYGLVSEEELLATGLPPERAHEMARVKQWFAFGRIRPTEELLDLKVVDKSAIELRPGVFIHRTGLNHYRFVCGGDSVEVDMNLGDGEDYEAPYALGSAEVRREYFSIIHTGEGDGWDTTKPSMGSIVCFQGKLFLVDAGPNIVHSLTALGISSYEIEGIFQTHSHDDHFAGLTSLIRSDHRLKYYATPFVRSCVQKKLAALMEIDEQLFFRFFEVCDLVPEEWNDIFGMEVRPVYSPHPVETTVLFFRALWQGRQRTYAHLADLPSLDVLGRMSTDDPAKNGISLAARDAFVREILAPVDVKKTDSGGGMIHGCAEDFAADTSGKILLSHRNTALTDAQKEIGSNAAFGLADVLIHAHNRSYLLRSAHRYLKSYFPAVAEHELEMLTNCPFAAFYPGSIILKKGIRNEDIFLVLSGVAEFSDREARLRNRLSAGAMIGELPGFLGTENPQTFRAVSPITALRIPCEVYRYFVKRNGLFETIQRVHENRSFLFQTSLFGELVSFQVQSEIAGLMQDRYASKGAVVSPGDKPEIYLLAEGEIALHAGGRCIETLARPDFWSESYGVSDLPPIYQARAQRDCRYFAIPAGILKEIPIVLWKLLETHNRRMKGFRTQFRFEWMDFYSLGIRQIDSQHRGLFEKIEELARAVEGANEPDVRQRAAALLESARLHFREEESLLQRNEYPSLATQQKAHGRLIEALERLVAQAEDPLSGLAVSDLFKDWLINHTLLEDRKYKAHLAERGVH